MNKTRVYYKSDSTKYWLWQNEAGIFSWDADNRSFKSLDLAINTVRKEGRQIKCKLIYQ